MYPSLNTKFTRIYPFLLLHDVKAKVEVYLKALVTEGILYFAPPLEHGTGNQRSELVRLEDVM